MFDIKRVAVLGTGWLGAQIAAQLANCGIASLLLDAADDQHPDQTPQVVLESALKGWPAALHLPEYAERIAVGSVTHDLPLIGYCDWIIDAVDANDEDLNRMCERLSRLARHRRPDSLMSAAGTGLSIRATGERLAPDLRRYWFGSHFSPPVRYRKLVELTPGPETEPRVIQTAIRFLEGVLGKGVIVTADSPGYLADRLALAPILLALQLIEAGLSPEEVESAGAGVTGGSGLLRSVDFMGLDTVCRLAQSLRESSAADGEREVYRVPEFVRRMVAAGLLGQKAGQGLFRVANSEAGLVTYVIEPETMTYRLGRPPEETYIEMTETAAEHAAQLRELVYRDDRQGQLWWRIAGEVFTGAAEAFPKLDAGFVQIDDALRWGHNWKLGPFELWDAIGVTRAVERLRAEGRPVPALAEQMLQTGAKSFYRREVGRQYYFDPAGEYRQFQLRPGVTKLRLVQAVNGVVSKNPGATILDLGDGIAGLEFHSESNAFGHDVIIMTSYAIDLLEYGDFDGLVIGHEGVDFSTGLLHPELSAWIEAGDWRPVEERLKRLQQLNLRVKYAPRPVVVAPFGLTLGNGCELALHAPCARAAAETYPGLVSILAGLVPAGGGVKELYLRRVEAAGGGADLFPAVRQVFDLIASARVSASAAEAKRLGYFRGADGITYDREYLVEDARQTALGMFQAGYKSGSPRDDIPVLGESAYLSLKTSAEEGQGQQGDRQGGRENLRAILQVASIITGGHLPGPALVSEQYLLDLEREAFLSLCGERDTLARVKSFPVWSLRSRLAVE